MFSIGLRRLVPAVGALNSATTAPIFLKKKLHEMPQIPICYKWLIAINLAKN